MPNNTLPTYESIWKTLKAVDVSDVVQTKNDCMYLQWMRAWSILMDHYPQAIYKYGEPVVEPDGTMTVSCTIKIGDAQREMFLPVMTGFRNSAKPHPDARCIGDNKMRCFVKCMAMFGLGSSIFYGELCAPHGTEVEQQKPFKNMDKTNYRSSVVPLEQVEQQVGQQAAPLIPHLLQSPISKTACFEAGKYAFVNLYEFEQWVISKKGMRFEDLGHESRERMIQFFGNYASRDQWPNF